MNGRDSWLNLSYHSEIWEVSGSTVEFQIDMVTENTSLVGSRLHGVLW